MDFEEFRHHIGDLVKEALEKNGREADITYIDVNGSNGKYPALVVKLNEQLGASFHMDAFFNDYTNGDSTIDSIVDSIVKASTRNISSNVRDYHTSIGILLTNYSYVKKKLFIKATYVENAKDSLMVDSPYKQFEDIVISYHVLIREDSQGFSTTRINNNLLNTLGVTAEELHKAALANHEKLFPSRVQSLVDVMREKGAPEEVIKKAQEDETIFPIVNDHDAFAAASMFIPKAMAKVAERLGESFYILPSSVNELLAVPEHLAEGRSVQSLNAMIAEVNENTLEPHERLSYNAFHYDADAKKLELATKYTERVKQQEAPSKKIKPRSKGE